MVITVEGKFCTTGLLIPDEPQHGILFRLIQRVTYVNDEKSLIRLLQIMLAYNPHYMYPPLYQFHDKVGQFYITQASLYYRPVTIIIYILYMVLSFWLPTGFW